MIFKVANFRKNFGTWGNPEKVCSFLKTKTPIFILKGTGSKPIVFDFLYFFIEKKICAVHFKKYIFFLRALFHFFTFFSLRFISTQSDFGANKRALKHCTPPIIVSLASSTAPGPILIPKWVQKTNKERQDLHIPKYSNNYPWFFALFLHFFGISRCKCTF